MELTLHKQPKRQLNMNTPTHPADLAYSVEFWTTLQKEYLTYKSYAFCGASLTFETLWANDSFRHACQLLANKFAESLGHLCDYASRFYLFSEVSYPSLFEYYDAKTPFDDAFNDNDIESGRSIQLRRVVRLDFLDWIIAGLTDGTLSLSQNDL